jgi:hypothetical protein
MAEKNSVSITVKLDPRGLVPLLKTIRDNQAEALKNTEKMIANLETPGESFPDPEIFIIDLAAIPAAYYLRDSVVEAVRAEILRDYQNGQPIPAGASLKNEVEARSGETDKVSDPSDDNTEQRTGSEDPASSADNGSEAGSSSPDPSGPRG